MGVSISTVWYKIKKKIFKNVYKADCGQCFMIDKDEVMKIVKEIDKNYQKRNAKKEEILNKESYEN